MQNHQRDREEPDVAPESGHASATDPQRVELAAFHTLIREIHRSEEDQQAAEREIGATQLRLAKGLNRISAIGAFVGAIGSIGVVGSLIIAKIAADDAHTALVVANRAWISPVSAMLAAIPNAPPTEGVNVPLPFRNTGHVPATDAFIISSADSLTIDASYDEVHAKEQAFENYCFSISSPPGDKSAVSIVIFPGGGATNDFNGSITIEPGLIDWEVVYGRKYVFLHACVVYQTFGQSRHTSVCYYAQAGKTLGSLPFCDKGNRAN